ncbi:MAG: sugar ABC transporter permease [Trueperaceae bacterium]|nr:sugar ABC transporter permease [Trueperaceae bacterium]
MTRRATDPTRSVAATRRGGPTRQLDFLPWLVPLVVIVAGFYLYPAVEVVRFAFTDASLLADDYRYTTDSFRDVLSSAALPGVLRVTLIIVLSGVLFQIATGLGIALSVNRGAKRGLIGTQLVRTVVIASWVVPAVATGIVFRIILNEASYGLVTSVLGSLGFHGVSMLSDPQNATASVVVANVWSGTAFSMILLYAGLQSIPQELYEAADIDGATSLQGFVHITLPQLRPVLLTNLILITIGTFNAFALVLALTGGGPGRATEVLALYTYNTVFWNFDLAAGSVLAVLMMTVSLVFTVFYVQLLPKERWT